MRIYVFSYNRGRFLRNCLASLQRHAPAYPVTVMDDGSEDPEVHNALAEAGDQVSVIRSQGDSKAYHGGLYGNMQHALDLSGEAGEDLALFMQDDMQIVRDLEARDEAHWERFFEAYPQAIELAPTFFKPTDTAQLDIDHEVPVYFRDPTASRRIHFQDVGLIHAGRLRAQKCHFGNSEGENDKLAQATFGQRAGFSPYPFMMWLPNMTSLKFRRRGLLHRFAEWYLGAGFYPYKTLSQEMVDWLWERKVDKLPMAKDILSPEGLSRDRWTFEDATKSIKPIHRHLKKKKKRDIKKRKKQNPGSL